MKRFHSFIREMVSQTKGLTIVEERPEGFLLSTESDGQRFGRLYVVSLTVDTVLFFIPGGIYLQFAKRSDIPKWLEDFLNKRASKHFAEWALMGEKGDYEYALRYVIPIDYLTPEIFQKITFAMFKEHMQFMFWAMMLTKLHRKSFREIEPTPADISMGLRDIYFDES